jgi:excinuclease ABC subunit A
VLATGTPEEVAEVPDSHTGYFLRRILGLAGEPAGSAAALDRAAKANGVKAPAPVKAATKAAPVKKAVAAKSAPAKKAAVKAAAASAPAPRPARSGSNSTA